MDMPPAELARLIQTANRNRDSEWTSKALGLSGQILTPEEAAQWLQQDRIQRARHVADASRPKGHPKHY